MYLPEELDAVLRPLVAAAAPAFLDHYRWIIHSINHQFLTDRRVEDEDSFVPLNSDHLRSIISQKKTSQFLRDLIRWGLIETNRSWWRGHFSNGYRITASYRNSKVVPVAIADRLVNKHVGVYRDRQRQDFSDLSKGYSHVAQSLQALSIEADCAWRYLDEHYPINTWKSNIRRVAVDSIARGDFRLKVGPKGQRAHHNLSNLPKDLRPFLRLQGGPILQVDIGCSQPFFMHLLFRKEIEDVQEMERMEDLVCTRMFYAALNHIGKDEEVFKKRVYRDLLFKKGNYVSDMEVAFRSMFPSYMEAIVRFRAGKTRSLAAQLQQEEAAVIFNAVERFVDQTEGKVPILTIHDSLVTTPEYIALAQDAMRSAFQDLHGLVPLLQIK